MELSTELKTRFLDLLNYSISLNEEKGLHVSDFIKNREVTDIEPVEMGFVFKTGGTPQKYFLRKKDLLLATCQ